MNEVVVALVTFNRQACLERVLEGILKQNHGVSAVVIVDNCSTDNTNEFLSNFLHANISEYLIFHEMYRDGKRFIYYRNNRNVGGSGGFAIAINRALEEHCDYIWIMDDDVYPEPDCLKLMLDSMNNDVMACIPNRTDENFDDHACQHIDFKSVSKFRMFRRKKFYPEPLTENSYRVCDMAFEGPLIKKDVVAKVGLPNTGFFIEYDDTDYAQRLLKYTSIMFISGAILHRQLAKKNQNQVKTYRYNWRNYYSIRNNILFNHMYGETWGAKHLGTTMLFLWHFIRSIRHLEFGNIKIIFKATIDGARDITGIIVKPGEF